MKFLLNAGLIEMMLPDVPRSKSQKYRLSEKGRIFLSQKMGATLTAEPRYRGRKG